MARTTANPKITGRRAMENEGAAEVQVCKKAKVPGDITGGFNRHFGPARQATVIGAVPPAQGSSGIARQGQTKPTSALRAKLDPRDPHKTQREPVNPIGRKTSQLDRRAPKAHAIAGWGRKGQH
eukprot:7796613-Heterocapsa_arctica.AAC.1